MSEESIAVDRNRQESTGIEKTPTGWHVRAARYEAQIIAGPAPEIHISREGWRLMRLQAVSALDGEDAAEIFAPPMLCLAFGAHGRCQ